MPDMDRDATVEDDVSAIMAELTANPDAFAEEEAPDLQISQDTGEDTPPASTQEDGDGTAETAPDEPGADEDQQLGPLEPDTSWSVDAQESFRKLPEDMQRLVLDRVGEAAEREKAVAAGQERYGAIDRLLTDERQQALAMQGLTPGQAVEQLFMLSDFAQRDPVGFIQRLAQERQIDLGTLGGKPAAPAAATGGDDDEMLDEVAARRIAAIEARNAELSGQMDKVVTWLGQQSDTQQNAIRSDLQTEIDTFKGAKNEDGSPKHPHFEALQDDMAALLGAGRVKSLSDAYDRALYAHPETRAKVLAAERAAEQRKAQADREARVQKARAAGSSISGTVPATQTSAVVPDTVEETIRQVMTGALQ